MLNKDYGSKVACPAFKQVETSFLLAVTKSPRFSLSHNVCFSHLNSFHTSAHTLPSWSRASGCKSVSCDYSPYFSHLRVMFSQNWTPHLLWSCQFPKPSSFPHWLHFHPFSTFPDAAPPCPSLVMSWFSFTDWILEMLLDTNNDNSWWGTSYSMHHPRYVLKKGSGDKSVLSWSCPLSLNAGRRREVLEGRTGKLPSLSSTWGNSYSHCWWCWLGGNIDQK